MCFPRIPIFSFLTLLQALYFSVNTFNSSISKTRNIYFMALLCFSGHTPTGYPELTAMQLAVEHINQRNDLLPGYNINIIKNDTQCDPGVGINVMYELLYQEPKKIILIGTSTSTVTEMVARASHLFNLIQISPHATSPTLSNRKKYPRFFRTIVTDAQHIPARIALLKEFGWSKIVILDESQDFFAQLTKDFKVALDKNNITLLTSEVFKEDPSIPIQNIKQVDARIIFGGFFEDKALNVFCQAYKSGIFGPKYVWFIPGWFSGSWWRVNTNNSQCKQEEIFHAMDAVFSLNQVFFNPNQSEISISGLSIIEFEDEIVTRTNHEEWLEIQITPSYDAIWAAALGLNSTLTELNEKGSNLSLQDFTYKNNEMGQMILENMRKVEFIGLQGPIQFNANGDINGILQIERQQGFLKEVIGHYYHDRVDVVWMKPVRWKGHHPPHDSILIDIKTEQICEAVRIITFILASFGILLTLGFLIFNITHQNLRIIKLSSPKINIIILLGCLGFYIPILFPSRKETFVLFFCQFRKLSLTTGFSLVFGALFAKTWRVHVICSNTGPKSKIIKDAKLMSIIALILIVNLVVLTVGHIMDPQYLVIHNVTLPVDKDTMTIRQFSTCFSKSSIYFTGGIYIIQGVLLMFGVFLAWGTRNIHIPALNDSQVIAVCIYNTLILSIIGVGVSFIVDDPEITYTIECFCILIGTTAIEMIIFVPKILNIMKFKMESENCDYPTTEDNNVQQTGFSSRIAAQAVAPAWPTIVIASSSEIQKSLADALERIENKEKEIKELQERLNILNINLEISKEDNLISEGDCK